MNRVPRPLPVLRMPHKLQKPLAVLSGRLQYLAEVAQSPNAREGNDVGEVHPTRHHPLLRPWIMCCHGRPKRARSWKRPIQPRKAYSALASLLLG